jgi:hypothetical protein
MDTPNDILFGNLIMKVSVQFLEGGPASANCPPAEAGKNLRSAFDRLPIDNIFLGWNLPSALVETCAEECGRAHAGLYLWHPLLSGDGVFLPRPERRTIGLNGEQIADSNGRDEFTFVCPNRPGVHDAVLRHLEDALASGLFQGVFLDRIRFPSPAADPARNLACFCDDCVRVAESAGVDWPRVRENLHTLLQNPDGRRRIIHSWISPRAGQAASPADGVLAQWIIFRNRSITAIVRDAAELVRARGLKIGLDCFSPALAQMVGQNLAELSACCDWIKGMVYLRAFGPAAIPFELLGLADALRSPGTTDDGEEFDFLAQCTGWEVPSSREEIRRGRLPSSILAAEIARGREACNGPFLAGVELVEIPGVAELDPVWIQKDWQALAAARPDGVVLSWDLRHIPPERLEMVNRLFSAGENP